MAKRPKPKMSSLDDPRNTTSKFVKVGVKPKDTVHVKSDLGYKMAVGRDSKMHNQAKKMGSVISNWRASGPYTEDTDPLAVKNYSKRGEMRRAEVEKERAKRRKKR